MFLHLDDTRPDTDQIERAISLREAVVASVVLHVGLIVLILWLPTLPFMQRLLAQPQPQPIPMEQRPQQDRAEPFVMVEPRLDREALRKMTRPAPRSDADREARSRERNPNATNNQPFLRGRSADLTEAQKQADKPKGQGPSPEPSPPSPVQEPAPAQTAANTATPPPMLPQAPLPTPRPQTQPVSQQPPAPRGGQPPGGALGEALKNLNRYAQDQQLNNPNGRQQVDQTIQFDSKGVEFGPWLRRFVAQVKRNWFVPMAAMSLKGHVVITFNVHKDGRITDLQVLRPERRHGLQQRRHERPGVVEPDDGAAAGVSVRQGVLHGDLLLQRSAAVTRPELRPGSWRSSARPRPARARWASPWRAIWAAKWSPAIRPPCSAASTSAPTRSRPTSSRASPHHLVDVADPTEVYSAARYAQDAAATYPRHHRPRPRADPGRRHRPLLPGPGARPVSRVRRGTRRCGRRSTALPPSAARASSTAGSAASTRDRRTRIQPRDTKRLVRAIEVALVSGVPMTAHFADTASPIADYDVIAIGVRLPLGRHGRIGWRDASSSSSSAASWTRCGGCSRPACRRRPRLCAGWSTGRWSRCSPACATRRPRAN